MDMQPEELAELEQFEGQEEQKAGDGSYPPFPQPTTIISSPQAQETHEEMFEDNDFIQDLLQSVDVDIGAADPEKDKKMEEEKPEQKDKDKKD